MDTEKVLVAVLCYNTDYYTKLTLERFPKAADREYDVLLVNDGSTDNTKGVIQQDSFTVINHRENKGVGAAIKTSIEYALKNGYGILVIMAGNNKDDPQLIPRLLKPIIKDNYDYVQGSRFLSGGGWENLPLFRYIMVKIHAFMFYFLTGFKGTDALNGFRAYRLDTFNDRRINIWQDWLNRYELETYLHYKVLKLGYRVKEVPVTKTYPENRRAVSVKYTHIRPFIDWWVILRPLIYLLLRVKR
jgi:dolichol-phosphate mannosyltransferase